MTNSPSANYHSSDSFPSVQNIQLPPTSVRIGKTDHRPQDDKLAARQWATELLKEIESLASHPGDTVAKAICAMDLLTKVGALSAHYFTVNRLGELRLCVDRRQKRTAAQDAPALLLECCKKTSIDKERRVYSDVKNPGSYAICVALSPLATYSDVLTVSITGNPSNMDLEQLRYIEQIILSLRVWRSQVAIADQETDLRKLAALMELVAKVTDAASLSTAALHVVNELQVFVGCRQVALGLKGKLTFGTKLAAISGHTTFDRFSDVAKAYQSSCDETLMKGELGTWPPLNPQSSIGMLALRKLVECQNVDAGTAVPLMHGTRTVGVLVLTGSHFLREDKLLGLLHAASPMLGSALQHASRSRLGLFGRIGKAFTGSKRTAKLTMAAFVLATASLLMAPWPYTMKVPCKAEPKMRRLVGAPHDGIVESALIRSGNFVQENQILANMDSKEIRWEIATLTAEKHRYHKEYDKELADDNTSKAQIALIEVERIQRKLQLLEHREFNHAILAPISGMVLTGELEKLSGAPVRMGQVLFEVAQLDPLRIELEVPAIDYFYLKSGQEVSIRFEGFLSEDFQGVIASVRPRSEVRDSSNVFVAELEIANPDFRVRPGVQGYATITGDRFPIAWNLFHKTWEALRSATPTLY